MDLNCNLNEFMYPVRIDQAEKKTDKKAKDLKVNLKVKRKVAKPGKDIGPAIGC